MTIKIKKTFSDITEGFFYCFYNYGHPIANGLRNVYRNNIISDIKNNLKPQAKKWKMDIINITDDDNIEISENTMAYLNEYNKAFQSMAFILFNPEKIEEALNAMGKEGWEIDGVTSAEFPSLTGGRQELVIFLSKDV